MPRKKKEEVAITPATPAAPVKRTRRKRLSEKAVREALERHDGNLYHTARALSVGRTTLAKFMRANPQMEAFREELIEAVIDRVESVLIEKCLSGDNACIFFFLKTRAQHRGYVEKLHSNILANLMVKVEWNDAKGGDSGE